MTSTPSSSTSTGQPSRSSILTAGLLRRGEFTRPLPASQPQWSYKLGSGSAGSRHHAQGGADTSASVSPTWEALAIISARARRRGRSGGRRSIPFLTSPPAAAAQAATTARRVSTSGASRHSRRQPSRSAQLFRSARSGWAEVTLTGETRTVAASVRVVRVVRVV
jgi:hypothetical protein